MNSSSSSVQSLGSTLLTKRTATSLPLSIRGQVDRGSYVQLSQPIGTHATLGSARTSVMDDLPAGLEIRTVGPEVFQPMSPHQGPMAGAAVQSAVTSIVSPSVSMSPCPRTTDVQRLADHPRGEFGDFGGIADVANPVEEFQLRILHQQMLTLPGDIDQDPDKSCGFAGIVVLHGAFRLNPDRPGPVGYQAIGRVEGRPVFRCSFAKAPGPLSRSSATICSKNISVEAPLSASSTSTECSLATVFVGNDDTVLQVDVVHADGAGIGASPGRPGVLKPGDGGCRSPVPPFGHGKS